MEIAIILMLGLLVGAYLLGAVPTSYLLGRWVLGIDLSQEGSGNLGASNLARRSPALGGVALLLDAAKGWLPAAAGLRLAPGAGLAAGLAFAAVVGHCWSIYRWRAPQKGGKGVATLCGALLALVPWLLPVVLVAFLVATPLTGYRALGTLVAAALAEGGLILAGAEPALLLFGAAALVLLLITHRENLQRIARGEEARGFFPRR